MKVTEVFKLGRDMKTSCSSWGGWGGGGHGWGGWGHGWGGGGHHWGGWR